jgi:O-antigen/teichoic acid export membrane protein
MGEEFIFKDKISKNSLWIFGSSAFGRGFLFLFYIFIARVLGKEQFGQYSFAYTFVVLWGFLMDWGFSTIVTKRIVRNKENHQILFHDLFAKEILVSITFLCLAAVSLIFLKIDVGLKVLIGLMLLGMVLDAYLKFFCGVYRAFEAMEYESILVVIQKVLFIFLSTLFILIGWPLYSLGISFILSYIVSVWVAAEVLRKRFKISLHARGMALSDKAIWKEGFSLCMVAFFTFVYFRIDILMLKYFHGDTEVGIYNAAYILIQGLMLIPMAVLTATFPSFSKGWVSDVPKLQKDYQKSFSLFLELAFFIFLFGFLWADKIISVIYTEAYQASAVNLKLLLIALLFIFPNYVLTQLMVATDSQDRYAFFAICCAFINVGLNFFFIPIYKGMGAAVATIITELTLFILLYLVITKKLARIDVKRLAYIFSRLLLFGFLQILIWHFCFNLVGFITGGMIAVIAGALIFYKNQYKENSLTAGV